MTRKILDIDGFLENLTDSVNLETTLSKNDPGGRMTYRLSDVGVFFPFDCEVPLMAIWLPSEAFWEANCLEEIRLEEIERAKQINNQEPEEKFCNGAKKPTTLSRG